MAIRKIDYSLCNDCGKCVTACPMDVFQKLGTMVYVAYQADCMTCFLCEIACAPKAIRIGPERGYAVVQPY